MEYDYIIIGAGSAGCVLANRLTENPSCRVLLIEAGMIPSQLSKVPAVVPQLCRSRMDWGFQTTPQKHLNNRNIYIPRGKALGGSSSTNAMVYVRGNSNDYDAWEKAGNAGWGYTEVLKYFKKSEHHETYENNYHAKSGPLNVCFAQNPSILGQVFINACEDSGIPFNEDYNGSDQLGASMFQFTIKNNTRWSTYDAFLVPALGRENLQLRTGARVARIIIEDGVATGVEMVTGENTTEIIHCTKEVILSAGAIQSPQILLLSGVGQKEALARFDIECKVALEGVGKNLQDHFIVPISAECNVRTINYYLNRLPKLRELSKYYLFKTGEFANAPLSANAFFSTKEGMAVPDAQFHFLSFHIGNDPNGSPYDVKTYSKKNGYSVLATLLHPESRGEISLQSSNPNDAPLIQGNYLSDERDQVTMRRIVRKALAVANADSFKEYAPRGTYSLSETSSDEEVDAYIRSKLETVFHPVGTCKMGNDEASVVNSRLQVYGVERLRVIDASIMPKVISGNTNAPTIMIAEKGADLIKEDFESF